MGRKTQVDINAIVLGENAYNMLVRRRMIAQMLVDGKSYSFIEEKLSCSSALIADVSRRLKAYNIKF